MIEEELRGAADVQNWQNIAPGGSLQGIGANVWGTTISLAPTAASINGESCQVKSV